MGGLVIKKISHVFFLALLLLSAVCEAEAFTTSEELAPALSPAVEMRLREMEQRLRQTGLPAMRRAWKLEMVPTLDVEMDIRILPDVTGHILRVFMPQHLINRPGLLEKAMGRVANALCWLGSDPHPLARPHTPYWLSLGWKGWLDTNNKSSYERVVAQVRSTGNAPTLQEILAWEDDAFSTLEESYRTALCYWLVRSLLRDHNRATRFFSAQSGGVEEALALLPRGWWNARLAEARSISQSSPFLSVAETRKKIIELLGHAPAPLIAPSQPLRNSRPVADVDASARNVNPRLTRSRDVNAPPKTPDNPAAKIEEINSRGWSARSRDASAKQESVSTGNSQDNATQGAAVRPRSRSASPAPNRTQQFGAAASTDESLSLLETVRRGRSEKSLNSIRQARYLATELTSRGSPVYRDAVGRLAVALTNLERHWNFADFQREHDAALEEVNRIGQLESVASSALDWAEAVFFTSGTDPHLAEYVDWRKSTEALRSPSEQIDEILMWRERIENYSVNNKSELISDTEAETE